MSSFIHERVSEQIRDDILDDGSSFDNTTTVVSDGGEEGPNNAVGVLLLALFAIIINLVLFLPPYFVRRRRMREQAASREAFRAAQANGVVGGFNKHDRYDKIESWVVSKQIYAHDEICETVCQLTVKTLDTKPRLRKQTMSTVDSIDTEEEDEEMGVSSAGNDASDDGTTSNELECPICFDTFDAGDIASWSADPACKHVFHHRCIKEWLVKSKGCPFCRETFLPVDRMGSNLTFANLSELIVAQENRSLHCYYCVDHGIVSIPKDLEATLEEQDRTKVSQRAQEVPERSILSQMRGPVKCLQCDVESGADEVALANDEQEVPSNDSPTSHTNEVENETHGDDPASPNEEESA